MREALDRKGLLKDFGQHVDRIERQFNEVQSILLTAAAPGLTFAVVIHQAEKVLKELVHAVDGTTDPLEYAFSSTAFENDGRLNFSFSESGCRRRKQAR